MINRQILRLAAPAIVNNVTVPLLGLCDTAIAGHLGSPSYIGAMAVGSMMLNVIFWLCGFLRMGTTGLTARAYGAGNPRRSTDILRKALVIGLAISVAVLLLQTLILRGLSAVVGAGPDVEEYANLYFNICVWGIPAQLAVMAASGWFIGMQNTVVPMAVAIGVNLLNVAASLILVFACGLGFRGIALGTLIANWGGAAAILLMCRRSIRRMHPAEEGVCDKERWGRFFSVNSNLFLRSACIMTVSMSVTTFGARMGDLILASNAVMMQFFIFFSYFMDGFAFAAEALVGKASGAGDIHALRRAVRALLLWGGGMAVTFLLIYLAGATPITTLLTDEPEVIQTVAGMKGWLVALPPVTVAAFIFDGVYIGMARTRLLFLTTLAASAVFFIIILTGSGGFDVRSDTLLWLAFESYLLIRGVILACEYSFRPLRT